MYRSIFLLMALCAGIATAQEALIPEWVMIRRSAALIPNVQAWGIDGDTQGNLYWSTNILVDGRGFDVFTYKLSPDSQSLWPQPSEIGGQFNQQIYKVTAAEGVIYLCGRSGHGPNLLDFDMFVAALDPLSGDTLWSTVWDGGFGYDEADGLVIRPDGIYVTGWANGGSSNSDAGLMKLSLAGDTLWTRLWGSPLNDHLDGHSVVDDSMIYAAGLYRGDVPNDRNGRSLLAKFSQADGSLVDSITYGRNTSNFDFENALGMASDGTFLYVVGVTSLSFTDWQIYLRKFDKNLNPLWETLWGGPQQEVGRAIAVGDDGSIFIVANSTDPAFGDADVVLLNFSPAGQLNYFRTWGGPGLESVQDIFVAGGAVYLTGQINCTLANVLCDGFLLKADLGQIVALDPPRQGGRGTAQRFSLGQNYPNPFNPATSISFYLPHASPITLHVYDELGRRVTTLAEGRLPAGSHTVVWDGTGEAGQTVGSGIYYYTLTTAGRTETRKMLLVH